jgi:hypothetical protein
MLEQSFDKTDTQFLLRDVKNIVSYPVSKFDILL